MLDSKPVGCPFPAKWVDVRRIHIESGILEVLI
jgi:hypothetical protein